MLPETQMKLIQEKSGVLSLEAAAGNESFASAMQQLPDLLSSVRKLFSTVSITKLDRVAFFGSPLDKVASKLAKRTYLDFQAVKLPVPEGLIVPYVIYQEKLQAAVNHVTAIDATVLKPFQTWLGRGIGSPSALSSVMSSLRINVKKEEEILVRLERDLVSCFVQKGTRFDEVPYTSALRNQADWGLIMSGMRTMQDQLNQDFEKTMSKRLDSLDTLLDTLIQRVEEKHAGYELSPKTLTELASMSGLMASELEYYSIVRYRLDSYIRAINAAAEKINKF